MQFAYVKNVNVEGNLQKVESLNGFCEHFDTGRGVIEFTGEMPLTPATLKAVNHWMMKTTPRLPISSEEWLCLYCGGAESLERTKCRNCGAPRSWALG